VGDRSSQPIQPSAASGGRRFIYMDASENHLSKINSLRDRHRHVWPPRPPSPLPYSFTLIITVCLLQKRVVTLLGTGRFKIALRKRDGDRTAVARLHVAGKMTADPIAVACEAVTYRMCCSKGASTDGVYSHDIPVMHELQRWLEHHDTFPMVPPEESQAISSPSRLTY
jgi:hypothetical protein